VTGTLKTFVGAQVIASDERRFRFSWTYRGLRLALPGSPSSPTGQIEGGPVMAYRKGPMHGVYF
jgi:hypothetical protein